MRERADVGGEVAGGNGTLSTESVLVVNQRAKLVEVANEYAVHDQNGHQLGSVVQVGQNAAKKALRALTKVDALLAIKLEIRDVAGNPVLLLHRPATLWKSTMHVTRPDGSPVGSIRTENVIGKNRFAFEVDGQRVGGCTPRTRAPGTCAQGTSGYSTSRTNRSGRSPRPGKDWARPRSPRRTTTSSSSTARCGIR